MNICDLSYMISSQQIGNKLQIWMGNGSSKNDDFSRNPNFNMNQHSQAMATLNANYTDSNYRMGQNHAHHRTDVTETEFKAIHRTTSIYKPSLAIHNVPGALKIELEYDSDEGSKLQIYVAVQRVEEHPENKLTMRIESQLSFEQFLPAGKKSKFQKTYSLDGFNKVIGSTIIFRIINPQADERTEYSVKNIGKDNWKILLEKLEYKGIVTQLQNIYKGGNESDECIICFTEKVNTLIDPCNHLCLCFDCCEQVRKSTNTCPICRTNIKAFKRIRGGDQI